MLPPGSWPQLVGSGRLGRFIGLAWRWERSGYIGFQRHYGASIGVVRLAIVGCGGSGIVLRGNLADISRRGSLPIGCLSSPVFPTLYLYSDLLMLAIRLSESVEKRLALLAKRTGRTKTFCAREAILKHLEDMEDLYVAEERLKALRAGRSRTFSLDEVERDLGLDR